ncbi:MAG: hypothetical protein IAX21_02820 [Candidatus Bathyarchaeota archaeon]|nr:hypothetical protein [Candidatus Bathyarchaeum tardum]WGM90056.1 MAG: hypothetical protein NUK63_02750 [Candidatus Bathyarchaeum tardum]WNZ29807.1 MAG: hypothetical protein IAX21_02820 [Candidatus Bathyarchaeota archaeon]
MGDRYVKILQKGKYLIPKNNIWLTRAGLLFGFILLDYLFTLIFINAPYEEGNLLVRYFMETYGIFWGLTIFDILINIPVYLIICMNSHLAPLPSKLSKIVDPIIDAFLAWFVAGYHYNGATSWFWAASGFTRQITGFLIYFAIIMVVYQASTIQRVFSIKTKNTSLLDNDH